MKVCVSLKLLAFDQALRQTVAPHAERHGEDPLVQAWCRRSVLGGLTDLVRETETLGSRFRELNADCGNDAADVEKAAAFREHLIRLRDHVASNPVLPVLEDWYPPAQAPGS